MRKIINVCRQPPISAPPIACRYFFTMAALLVALLIIYWPGFSGDWYLDDFGNIHENPNVHLTSLNPGEIAKSFYGMDRTHSRFNRPLSYLSLALNYYCGGTHPFGYHAVNFLVHYTTAVFLFLLTLNILKLPVFNGKYDKAAYAIALLSSFLWATHPIQVNAVTYIVQRMASLAGMFTVLSLYCYVKARTTRQPVDRGPFPYGWYAACLIAGAGAIASKQNAAMLPFSILLLEILLIRTDPHSRQTHQVLKILIPPAVIFLLLVVFLGGLTAFQSGYDSRPFTMAERLLTQPRVILFYIGQLLYPSGATFALLHDIRVSTSAFSPWTTLPAILLIVVIIGTGLRLHRKWPLFAFCTLFFFLNHAIEGSFIPLELIFEHRNYLPSLFFFLLPAIGFLKIIDYFSYSLFLRNLAAFGAIVWIIGQVHTTYRQNLLYTHPVAFWMNNVSLYPNLHRPRHNLARTLFIYGQEDEAEKQMYQSLDGKSSARIHQKYMTNYNLAVYYLYQQQYRQALEQFASILEANPHDARTLQKVAELHLETDHEEKALLIINKALDHHPLSSSLHIVRGFVMLSLGNIDAAFKEAARAENLKHNKLAVAYLRGEGHRLQGDLDNAVEYFEKIRSSGTDHYAALLALVELYYLRGNSARVDQTLSELGKVTAGRNFGDILATYNLRWNYVGKKRMENIVAAVQR